MKIAIRLVACFLLALMITSVKTTQAQPTAPTTSTSGTARGSSTVDIGTAMGISVSAPSEDKKTDKAAGTPHDKNDASQMQDVSTDANAPSQTKSTAARFMDAISKHPSGREKQRSLWKSEQDAAVIEARGGEYNKAMPVLERLHNLHPDDAGLAADHATVLQWAGHDHEAIAAYKELPVGGARPDYLIEAIARAYSNQHQTNEALDLYHQGLKDDPTNQNYMAGEILCLLEADRSSEAVAKATEASTKYPEPSPVLAQAIHQTYRSSAVQLGRQGHFKESLSAFASLREKYPNDTGIIGDDVAVLSWAGHDNEAVTLYRTLPADEHLDYVLDAAAHSYRNMGQPRQALELYQAALAKSPENVTYAVGVIYSLADLGRSDEAIKVATAQMEKHPEKPEALVKAYAYIERRHAIDLARSGKFTESLSELHQLHAKYPDDEGVVMDTIAVLSWAGRHKDAVRDYQKIAKSTMPDYVLEAVAHSYRSLHQTEKALAVYRRGSKQSPRSGGFASGEIRCLDDLGRYADGEERAKTFTHTYGDNLEVLLAGGEAANFNEDPVEALNFYEHANTLAPKNHEALRGLIHAEDRSGAPHLALKMAKVHPGLMNGIEYRALLGDQNSRLVRWGVLEPASEATRFDETDHALANLDAHINQWTAKNDPASYPDIIRARFDRLIALRDRVRMQDVIDDYNELVQMGVEVPAYALEPVGEAYLYLRQSEIARDVFLKVLETDPKNFEARRLLAYAYLESEQPDEAFAEIDQVVADEPQWIYLKGEPDRLPNPQRAMAELDAAQLRSFEDMFQASADMLNPTVEAAPYDVHMRLAAGNLALMRGWPRKALEHYQIGLAIQDGHNVGHETGIAMANLSLQNYPEAETGVQSLLERFPENQGVQRAAREMEIHNMAELDVHAGYSFAPLEDKGVNAPHGQGFGVGAELYSAPIAYNWRLFAGEDFAHEHEPNAEGIIDYSRSSAGVEYRKGDVTARAAPTYNAYNGSARVGLDGSAHYTFNDIWSAGIAAELFSGATPLRALVSGITANEYAANIEWRQSEERVANFIASVMTFSDHNVRTSQNADYSQRLSTSSSWQWDALASLGLSQNNKSGRSNYYSPTQDLQALAGVRVTNILYRHYETRYEHSLLVTPGLYAQQHYGTTPAWTVRYEHRLHYDDTLNAGAGVNYTHQDYDGSAQDAVSLTMDVVERF